MVDLLSDLLKSLIRLVNRHIHGVGPKYRYASRVRVIHLSIMNLVGVNRRVNFAVGHATEHHLIHSCHAGLLYFDKEPRRQAVYLAVTQRYAFG